MTSGRWSSESFVGGVVTTTESPQFYKQLNNCSGNVLFTDPLAVSLTYKVQLVALTIWR